MPHEKNNPSLRVVVLDQRGDVVPDMAVFDAQGHGQTHRLAFSHTKHQVFVLLQAAEEFPEVLYVERFAVHYIEPLVIEHPGVLVERDVFVFPMPAREVFVSFVVAGARVAHVKDGLLRVLVPEDAERHVVGGQIACLGGLEEFRGDRDVEFHTMFILEIGRFIRRRFVHHFGRDFVNVPGVLDLIDRPKVQAVVLAVRNFQQSMRRNLLQHLSEGLLLNAETERPGVPVQIDGAGETNCQHRDVSRVQLLDLQAPFVHPELEGGEQTIHHFHHPKERGRAADGGGPFPRWRQGLVSLCGGRERGSGVGGGVHDEDHAAATTRVGGCAGGWFPAEFVFLARTRC